MELLSIMDSPQGTLRQPAQEVIFPLSAEIKQIIAEMRHFIETLASPYGKPAGLAAPQVGHSQRVILFQIPPEANKVRKNIFDTVPLTVLINPSYQIIAESGKDKDWEACYSVPGKMGEVFRANEIIYQGFNEQGIKIEHHARGFLARVLQHEVDHLNGILYTDLIEPGCRFGSTTDMWAIRQAEMEQND